MPADALLQKYHVDKDQYFYCVSSLLPHKNLTTLLAGLQILYRRTSCRIPLLISGVGDQLQKGRDLAASYQLEDRVIFTGFVTNQERDCLYENCRIFLFPSIFEGFGMPPIEAMRKGKMVIMTRETCLEEVTQGRAVYVDDPLDPNEWAQKIEDAMQIESKAIPFETYELQNIVKQYTEVFDDIV
jgi:glycosyltransferase involved in cell wall biosynthesis